LTKRYGIRKNWQCEPVERVMVGESYQPKKWFVEILVLLPGFGDTTIYDANKHIGFVIKPINYRLYIANFIWPYDFDRSQALKNL
jgi:hypothetical protein